MINIKYVSLFSFLSFLILDYFIKNNYLGQSIKKIYFKFIGLGYLSIIFIITSIAFLIFMLFSNFGPEGVVLVCFDYSLFDNELFHAMSDSGGGNTNSGGNSNNVNADATINLNHPNLNVSIPASSLNNLAAAASVAGGGGLALKVMQQVPGGPGTKAVAGAATMLGAQALTVGMSKILNSNNSSNNKTQKLTDLFDNLRSTSVDNLSNNNLNIISNLSDRYNDFPLNLLPEIDQLATAELMFLFIILNIFIVKYITTLDYNKYMPNNKIGKILKFFINRYIAI